MTTLRLVIVVLLGLWTSIASATVERFAVIVGNNLGSADDTALRYAENDATKVARTLKDVGGFSPVNMVLLTNESAGIVRSTLIAVNDRIRAAQALPGTEALLFVYYSGHADSQALHLGRSKLEIRELAQLVRGSAARFRLLVVDACRAGVLTRSKGGRIVPPFDLAEPNLGGEGLAFLTASSANEDAQESDEIRGSFFTHAFVSGLLGAADRNGDGSVVLEEAYSYAYEATLRATSRTFAGTQHPTFQYETKGQGSLALTRPVQAMAFRAELTFPKGRSYLVMTGNEQGSVVAEIGAADSARSLSLAPGRYFVRGRARDHLEEGAVQLVAGQRHLLDAAALTRIEFARLVRKGVREQTFAQSLEAGMLLRPRISRELPDCWGAGVGHRLDFEAFSLRTRVDYCVGGFRNGKIETHVQEFSLAIDAEQTWDFSRFSLYIGPGVGGTVARQRYETAGRAPSRVASSTLGFLLMGADVPLSRRSFVGADMRLEGHLLRYQDTAFVPSTLRLAAALRLELSLGAQF